jgi:hypothetical protein
MKTSMNEWWKDSDRVQLKYTVTETSLSATLSTSDLTWTGMGLDWIRVSAVRGRS